MNNIIFTLNGTPINMTELWNLFKNEEDCVKLLCTKYAAEPGIAKLMVEDFKTQAGIRHQESMNHLKNDQKTPKENSNVKVVSIRCPDCNASLEFEQGRNNAFCQYCGAKIILFNENEHVYKHIDEAAVKNAETDRLIKLKELEMKEKSNNQKKKYVYIYGIVMVVILLFLIISILAGSEGLITLFALLLFVGLYGGVFGLIALIPKPSDSQQNNRKIALPMWITKYKNMDYRIVEKELRRAGFYNIRCIEVYDLKNGLFNSQDQVASLTIDGNQSVAAGQKYLPETPIVITYHSFRVKR